MAVAAVATMEREAARPATIACRPKLKAVSRLVHTDVTVKMDDKPSQALRRAWGRAVPAALVTADRDPTLRLRARARQVELLHKPVKPAALRALLRLSERITPAEAPVRVLR